MARSRSEAAKLGWETRRRKQEEAARLALGLTERQWRAKKGWETRRANEAKRAPKAARMFDEEFELTAFEANDILREDDSRERRAAADLFDGRAMPGLFYVTLNLILLQEGEEVGRYQPRVTISASSVSDALDQLFGSNGLYLRACRRIMGKRGSGYTMLLRSMRVENAPENAVPTNPDDYEHHFEKDAKKKRARGKRGGK